MNKNKEKNVKETLFDYVKDPSKWFYFYHNPKRLEKLHDTDTDHYKPPFNEEELKDEYDYDNDFKKNIWRFEAKTVGFIYGDTKIYDGDIVTVNGGECVIVDGNTIKIEGKTVTVNGDIIIVKDDYLTVNSCFPKIVNDGTVTKIEIQQDLFDFFNAVLDEMRIKNANAFAEYSLYISDNEDLAYFRNTVTKRELSADIDHNKQRDHAVHTLYNYILGWYIFENSIIKEDFRNYFKKSGCIQDQHYTHKQFYCDNRNFCTINDDYFEEWVMLVYEFSDVWHIASLLHDIGYILEGNLSSASPEVENTRIINGSKIIHDYFNHYFWKIFEVDFRVAKNIAKTLGVVVPDFKHAESLSSLGDHLCDIGSCENIRRQLEKIKTEQKKDERFHIPIFGLMEPYGLNREAISIWKKYYEVYGNKKMMHILHVVEKVYRDNLWVGSDYGKRNLDHGVCSGLIVLQALTFFRELYWGFYDLSWKEFHKKQKKVEHVDDESEYIISSNLVSEAMFNDIQYKVTHIPNRIKIITGGFRPGSWFKKVLWATASTAIHAIIQDDTYRTECEKHIKQDVKDAEYKNVKPHPYLRIGLDDPLAFLGILVDVLQEWDRYTVTKRGEAAFSGAEPLQNIDVKLGIDSHTIVLKYPSETWETWGKKLNEKLDKCLEKSESIVKIERWESKNQSKVGGDSIDLTLDILIRTV